MASRKLPGLGLEGFWDLGADAWNSSPNGGVDNNWRILSALVQGSVIDAVATLPGSPTNGDRYLMTDGVNENDIAIRDNGAWVYITPRAGCRLFNVAAEQFIFFNGTVWAEESQGGGGGGIVITRQVFVASGTWTKPEGLLYAEVEVVGGGGRGGSSNTSGASPGSGGGGGGYSRKMIGESLLGATEAVTVGGAGGTSSFGSHCSATGGGNGTGGISGLGPGGGSGGIGSGGDINIGGQGGSGAPAKGTGSTQVFNGGGSGGSSALGGGGAGGAGSNTTSGGAGGAGRAYGGGGGGAGNVYGASSGGAGAAGVVIVTCYIQGA